jgi:hypothetical protein
MTTKENDISLRKKRTDMATSVNDGHENVEKFFQGGRHENAIINYAN